jgi:hypothetical protein
VSAVPILGLPIEAGGTDAHLSHRYWTGTWLGGRVGSAGAVRRMTRAWAGRKVEHAGSTFTEREGGSATGGVQWGQADSSTAPATSFAGGGARFWSIAVRG